MTSTRPPPDRHLTATCTAAFARQVLLQSGANYNRTRPGGATALMDAAACGHEAVLRMIIDFVRSARRYARGGREGVQQPLHVWQPRGRHLAATRPPRTRHPPQVRNIGGYTHGALAVDAQDEEGRSALMHAARQSHENACLPLLQAGAPHTPCHRPVTAA